MKGIIPDPRINNNFTDMDKCLLIVGDKIKAVGTYKSILPILKEAFKAYKHKDKLPSYEPSLWIMTNAEEVLRNLN